MAREIYNHVMWSLSQAFSNATVLAGLDTIRQQVADGSPFAALKTLRPLIPIEDAILGGERTAELRLVGVRS
jgi:flagellar protein FlbT